MRLALRNLICLLTLLVCTTGPSDAKKHHTCPIGFNLAYTYTDDPVCYRQKGPEGFTDKFKDCVGNLYTSQLLSKLNLKTNKVLWADYKSMYPGGPYMDWSYTALTGEMLEGTFDVKYDNSLGWDQELCVVIDPVSNFTATSCDEKHYRYCFVHPYPDEGDTSRGGCTDLAGSWKFSSPTVSCLFAVSAAGWGKVRATWRQAHELCGGNLLNRGWRYANYPPLRVSGSHAMYPLGIVMSSDHDLLRYDAAYNTDEIPDTDWHFATKPSASNAVYGAVRDEFWTLVNSSYVFFDVVCEVPASLRHINLTLIVDRHNSVILRANDTITSENISCYSDASYFRRFPYFEYNAHSIEVTRLNESSFILETELNGYYWCVQFDYGNYHVSQSNRVLYVDTEYTSDLYACKIKANKEYDFYSMDKTLKAWRKKLEQFIYYKTKYIAVYGAMNTTDVTEAERVLKAFQSAKPELDWKDSHPILNVSVRRLYLDRRTALLHLQLSPGMEIVRGVWDKLKVLFMKLVYCCRGFESVPTLELGESIQKGCTLYQCIGDYNEGAQWFMTGVSNCTVTPPTEITESYIEREETTTWDPPSEAPDMDAYYKQNYTMGITEMEPNTTLSAELNTSTVTLSPPTNQSTPFPTEVITVTTPPDVSTVTSPPDETTTYEASSSEEETEETMTTPSPSSQQIQQVLDNLEYLLLNDSIPLESVSDTLDEVDGVLELQDGVIPSQLLHMLDELGTRIELQGQPTAKTVRGNIAMLLADVTPEEPVRGMRMAKRETDAFGNDTFSFIYNVDSANLQANRTEALVFLPSSVTRDKRRISFVAFRNEQAFVSDVAVNSRIFSVNVENVTQFSAGESIDIHVSPLVGEPDRNLSRTCAFWEFTAAGGRWSAAGCRLLRGGRGLLDTCRCTHLTHFAEVLVPRTLFSDRNETALEVLTLVGCFLSIIGLLLVGLTAALFTSWRRDFNNKIWLQLCIAIFVLVVCFVAVIFSRFQRYGVSCMLVGVALHYSVLSSFCWMLVAAVLSYRRLVLVFTRDLSHKLLRAAAFAWGAPCAVVGILLAADPLAYAHPYDDLSPGTGFCYPSGLGLYLAVYTPVAIMLLANWTLFLLILRSVFASRQIQRHGDSNEALRCASVSCLLVFLFGLPWVFGLFATNIVAAYLFTLTATFQGFVLFLFFVVGNKKTRDLWFNKLKIKQTRKVPVTSSTYTNRITDQRRLGADLPSSIEAKVSKPKSLSSPDNSRFS